MCSDVRAVFLLCLFLVGCAQEPSPDGTYTVVFRRYIGEQVVGQQTERGRWSYSNGMYVTLTQFMGETPADPTDRHFHDIYLIDSLERNVMTYRHVGTGRTFRSKACFGRVSAPLNPPLPAPIFKA
jgi:hypothetical protein